MVYKHMPNKRNILRVNRYTLGILIYLEQGNIKLI